MMVKYEMRGMPFPLFVSLSYIRPSTRAWANVTFRKYCDGSD